MAVKQGKFRFEFERPDRTVIEDTSLASNRNAQIPSPLILARRGGGSGEESMKEDRTGTEFPGTYCHISQTECPTLVGVGSRRKRLLGMKNIDVYALGLYVDEKATQKVLKSRFPGANADALAQDQKLCDEVINAQDLEKTLRIVITSGMVNHDRFVGALKESLVPACQKEGDTESLPQFEQLFEGAQFRKGMELAFTNTKSGGLAAKIDNRDVGEVGSKSFTKAFFGLYLGNSPVSKEGKNSISQGLAELAIGPSADPVDSAKGDAK